MTNLTPSIAAILRNYMRDPARPAAGAATLSELGIDMLDLPLIVLDLEDAFDIHMSSDDEIDAAATVDGLAALVAALIEAKSREPRRRTTVPRSKGTWISTGSERRR